LKLYCCLEFADDNPWLGLYRSSDIWVDSCQHFEGRTTLIFRAKHTPTKMAPRLRRLEVQQHRCANLKSCNVAVISPHTYRPHKTVTSCTACQVLRNNW